MAAPGKTGKRIADEIGPLLDFRAAQEQEIAEEVRDLRGPDPATMRRFQEESYYETVANTPAKRLLYQSEKLLDAIDTIQVEQYRNIEYWARRLSLVELVESYALIAPEEAFRILTNMEDSAEKVEATAKFGTLYNKAALVKARKLIPRIDAWHEQFDESRADLYIGLAGRGDDQSLSIAFKGIMDSDRQKREYYSGIGMGDYPDVVRKKVNQERLSVCVKLAAQGYLPAAYQAKLELLKQPSIPEIAALVGVDFYLERGDIVPKGRNEIGCPKESIKGIDDAWTKRVLAQKDDILECLKGMDSLPVPLDRFGHHVHRGVANYSLMRETILDDDVKIDRYIDQRVRQYTQDLVMSGGSCLQDLFTKTGDTKNYSFAYHDKLAKEKLRRKGNKILEFVSGKDNSQLSVNKNHRPSFMSYNEYVHDLQVVNIVCLFKAVNKAAVSMSFA